MDPTSAPPPDQPEVPPPWHLTLDVASDAAFDLRRSSTHQEPPGVGPTRTESLKRLLAACPGVPVDAIRAVGSRRDAIQAFVAHHVPQGGLVAVSEPSEDRITTASLSAGARYVDVGRDQRFVLREDAMDRVIADGAHLVALANPCLVTGVPLASTCLVSLRASGRPVVIDETDLATEAARVLHTLGGELPPQWMVIGPAGAPEGLHDRRTALSEVLAVAPEVIVYASEGASVFMRWPGRSGSALASAFTREGVAVAHRDHHTWRDGVRVAVPEERVLGPALKACRRALEALLLTCVALTSAMSMGCGSDPVPSAGVIQEEPVAQERASHRSVDATSAPAGVEKDLFKVPVVGGCGRYCPNPRAALTGWVMGMADGSADPPAARYLDSSQLSIDGVVHGPELQRMWRTGQGDARTQRIEALMGALSEDLAGTVPSELLQTLEAAPIEPWPHHATARWLSPSTGSSWRVSLVRRGREWLVAGVDRRPPTAAP